MSTFVNKSRIPESKVIEGTAKRNILRKGKHHKGRKEAVSGKTIIEDDGDIPIDKNDPSYAEDDEVEPNLDVLREEVGRSKLTLTAYKSAVQPLITEFFTHGLFDELLESVDEIGCPEYSYELVKRMINMSFDKTDRERELVSKVLSYAYPNFLSSNMIGKGFERLFELIDEFELDAPGARDMLSTFLARAVIDEVLPPSYLSDPVILNLGGDIVEHSKRMLSREHAAAKLEYCWGPGDGRPVEELKVAVDQTLDEFLLSKDVAEAVRCLQQLNEPHFFHEIVKRGVKESLDKSADQQEAISLLFSELFQKDLLSPLQAVQGFNRLFALLPDLVLDVPSAPSVLEGFVARAKRDHILEDSYTPEPQTSIP